MIKANLYSIDIKTLEKAIMKYQKQYDDDPNYIVMNTNTGKIINNLSDTEALITFYDKSIISDIKYYTFWGIPIAFCDKLKDGEIEII